MVRVKAKARKGDDAFQTRKQKVGRKKLAPATATRAEVHARTLRVTTPSAIAYVNPEEDAGAAADPEQRRQKRPRRDEEHQQLAAVSSEKLHRDFKEQLSNTRHYKKSFRGAGFMSLVRAIAANYEALHVIAQISSTAVTDLSDAALLSPIEILSAFTSALDAMSDTDGDVRRAALATLKIILLPPVSASASRGHGTDDDRGEVVPCRLTVPANGARVTCDTDRTRAVLRVVDVTLTHAMTSVRRSGIELLHLILQASPHGVRAVLRESDAWVKMVGRVSAVLLQGTSGSSTGANTMKMIHVVPDILETMLQQRENVACVGMDFFISQQGEKEVENADATPQRILELFEECTPKWSTEWKELMEMRTTIFRDAERVQRATAIARAFACITMYLRVQSLLSKRHMQLIRHLFTVKMPFTMHELTLGAAVHEHSGGHSHSKTRMVLANAIADACLPVADAMSDACQLVRDFLSAAFRPAKGATSSALLGRHPCGGGESEVATLLLGPLRTLRAAFVQFPGALLPRFMFLAPPMMQAAMRAVGGTDGCSWGEAALLAADVLAVLLASQAAAASKQGLRFLAEAVLAVPRLLFSLRGKTDTAVVDGVVTAFLRPLWRLASGGHPLLQSPTTSGEDAAAQLRISLPSLFEIRVPDAATPGASVTLDGVLPRCTEPTRELGAHLLFYLCGEAPCGAAAPPLALTVLARTLPCC
ncbi:hypothetical protein TraAM80_02962 [Trypanosoma rangeli]|uniref:Pre-rRNA-processing protein Ipi1 N-terminal domain-containing protein n=1 Tax=Trypanosoma rangeli TaxID=5698 RepID=A0A422NRI9_TRYRA|nr:uncharacterized protein TraAM80_02962 [Trypanosoma rangeli]RNF08029.1 hypothetical protein TraAM80_02962 [Trypanosoma rangeli]|eukprot:RNF08029.1 hypothetical protein TraAM80_02962 [Trypanosoma rangeli]